MSVLKDPHGNETKYVRLFVAPRGKRVLEIGCGDGRLTWRYARNAKTVTGIDVERDELRVAMIERPSDLGTRAAFIQADSIRLPFACDKFDLAILAWSL